MGRRGGGWALGQGLCELAGGLCFDGLDETTIKGPDEVVWFSLIFGCVGVNWGGDVVDFDKRGIG